MPRGAPANREIRDTRRREILRAAARVFAERGIREAKVGDIARAAGLSHGLIYHYFESKDALLEAIIEDKLEQIRTLADEVDTDGAPVLERIARSFDSWMAHVTSEPEMALVITQAVVNRALPDPLRERLATSFRGAFDLMCALIQTGQDRGEIRRDASAPELTTMLIATMRGLTLFHEVQLIPHPPIPRAGALLVAMLRPPLPLSVSAPKESKRRKEPRR